jgi:hypothetical protein
MVVLRRTVEVVELALNVVEDVEDAPKGPSERVALLLQEAESDVRADARPNDRHGGGDHVHHGERRVIENKLQ